MEHGDDVTRMMSSKKMAQAPINIKKKQFFFAFHQANNRNQTVDFKQKPMIMQIR